ncbi:MAG: rod shape-determining protein MreC [Candidatus Sulfotelmatobacter sp.]
MESVFGRYRNLTILVGVLFLQVLGLAVQVKRGADAGNARLIRIWAVDVITPFERALVWAQNGGSNLWHSYFFLRGVRAENRQLKQEIDQIRLEQVRLSEDAEQAHRLQSLLAFKEQFISKTVPAQVIGSSGTDLSRSIYIDKGSNEGIKPDMAVITAGGIVGKVWIAYPSTSLVLLINDQTSGVGAMLEKSRLQGVLKGTPDGAVILERVMSDEKVESGETVLSSGGEQIFPKGLPVGTVTRVSPGREMFLHIEVKPAADLSRLEEVLVVTEKQEQSAAVESGGRVRAADILAQRLPSVPDKPAAAGAAGATPAGSGTSGAPGLGTSAGAKEPTPAPAPGSAKPAGVQHAATPSITKAPGGGSTAVAPSGAKAASAGSAHGVSGNAQPTAGQAPKQAVPTAASGDSAASGSAGNAAGSNPADSPAKPDAAQPKSPGSQPNPLNPQAPATEDDPH